MDKLLHVKVGNRLKEEMDSLIDEGLFSNHAEIVREGLRDLLFAHGKIESLFGSGKKQNRESSKRAHSQ